MAEPIFTVQLRGVRVLDEGSEIPGAALVRTIDFYDCDVEFDPVSKTMFVTPTGGGGGGTTIAIKQPVRAATTANISLTGAQTIDGVSVVAGDRVLVKNQTTDSQNGIYVASAGAWSRAPDMASSSDVVSGMLVVVQEGTSNGDKTAMLTTNAPITLGTTSLTFAMDRFVVLTSSAPADVTKATASVGIATEAARADHKHDVSTAAPATTSVQIGNSASEGSSSSLARADHQHQVSAGAPVNVGTANSPGTAQTFARSDHVHNTPFSAVQTALGAATGSVSINSQKITNVASPTAGTDVANKTYVDSVSAGLDPKGSVSALAASNLTLSGLAQTTDGVALNTAGMRVLLTAQTTASQNGIWAIASGAWTRPSDFATGSDAAGAHTFVEKGSTYADTGWVCTTDSPSAVVDTNNLAWTQFTGTSSTNAGAGLTKTGNTIDVVANADGSIVVNADDVKVGVLATDAQHGNRGGGGIHAVATSSVAGFMSAADKTKLDGITGDGVERVGKQPVRAATTANVTLSGAQTIDGVALVAGDRVLVKNQTTGSQNGIYVVAAGAWSRSTDADASSEFSGGMIVPVSEGTVNGDRVAILTTNDPITLGTTSLTFAMDRIVPVTSTAPADVTKAASTVGTAIEAARADHKHDVSTAAPVAGAVQAGNAALEGTASSLSRSDHVHQVTTAAPVDVGTANSAGSSTSLARADHVHNTPFSAVQTALGAASGSVSVNSQKITNLATPTAGTDAANKAYVDAVSAGIDTKASVTAVGTANVASLSGLAQTVDGVALNTAGMRVLLVGQSTSTQNGIWVVASGAWTRPSDFAAGMDAAGAYTFAEQGTIYADTGWVCTTNSPNAVVGTNNLAWTQFTGLGEVTAGAGLTKIGNTIDVVANADGSIVVNADDVKVGVLATDAQHGNRGGGALHANATSSVAGFMSAADKAKLDTLLGNTGKIPYGNGSTYSETTFITDGSSLKFPDAANLFYGRNHANTQYVPLARWGSASPVVGDDLFYIGSTTLDAGKVVNMYFGIHTGGKYQWEVNGVAEYTADSSSFDYKSNGAVGASYYATDGTVPNSGYIRLRNGGAGILGIRQENKDNNGDFNVAAYASDNALYLGDALNAAVKIASASFVRIDINGSHKFSFNGAAMDLAGCAIVDGSDYIVQPGAGLSELMLGGVGWGTTIVANDAATSGAQGVQFLVYNTGGPGSVLYAFGAVGASMPVPLTVTGNSTFNNDLGVYGNLVLYNLQSISNQTTSGSATAGSAVLPSNPVGFISFILNGTLRKVPYYG